MGIRDRRVGILLAAALWVSGGRALGAARVVTINYSYDGGAVRLAVGDELDVRVGSTPGTGYSWSVAMNDGAVLDPIGKPVDDKSSDPRPGAPGSRLFRFRAAKAGSSSLGLVYERPWEKDVAPARLFHVVAEVTESSAAKPLRLAESDRGGRFFLLQGDPVSVRLPDDPSSGLVWSVTRNAPSILKPAATPKAEAGAGESPEPVQSFDFVAAGPGAASLELSYRKAADKDKPAERVWTIFVAVAGVGVEKTGK